MNEELYRYCPACGFENAPDADFCASCNAFISASKPTSKKTQAIESTEDSFTVTNKIVCSGCNEAIEPELVGDDGKYLCGICGLISSVDLVQNKDDGQFSKSSEGFEHHKSAGPISSGPTYGATIIELSPILTIGSNKYTLRENDVIGRQGTVAVDRFEPFDTVSRQHVVIVREQGVWGLRVPARVQNLTSLDGQELPRDQFVPLVGSHHLQLSTQCKVEIGLG